MKARRLPITASAARKKRPSKAPFILFIKIRTDLAEEDKLICV